MDQILCETVIYITISSIALASCRTCNRGRHMYTTLNVWDCRVTDEHWRTSELTKVTVPWSILTGTFTKHIDNNAFCLLGVEHDLRSCAGTPARIISYRPRGSTNSGFSILDSGARSQAAATILARRVPTSGHSLSRSWCASRPTR